MQIVIDIPEETYKNVRMYGTYLNPRDKSNLEKALENGTPLPKGHGRLIDMEYLKEHIYQCAINGRPLHMMEMHELIDCLEEVPTIIEADK